MKSTPNRFRLGPRAVMVAVVTAAFSNPALANTGRVDFTIGNVTVTGLDGRGRPLTKGAEVRSGDKIVSSVDGRAQIRFSDGAYVSLQPNSEFDIKDYRFDGTTDGKESAFFGLFKGAIRTVTGLVGGVNRNRYQLATPTATVGIRGTGGLIQIGDDGSTLVTGTSGIWSLTNQSGTLDVPAGTAGFAPANVNLPPEPRAEGPVLPPPQSAPPLPTIVQGDVVDLNGRPVSVGVTLPGGLISGPGYVLAGVWAFGTTAPLLPPGIYGATAVFDSNGALTSFNNGATTFELTGTQADFGTRDGVISWGRWTGSINVTVGTATTPVTLLPNDSLHYVVGAPTANMPTNNVNFTYNMIGATSPTLANASVAPGSLTSATLTGNFSTATMNVALAGSMGGGTFSANSTAALQGSTFSSVGLGTVTVGGGQLSCSLPCTVNVNGFFTGNAASHAGFVYQIGNILSPGGLTNLNGAVALMQ